jgi:putative salt-induced outer membrane protein YdiY
MLLLQLGKVARNSQAYSSQTNIFLSAVGGVAFMKLKYPTCKHKTQKMNLAHGWLLLLVLCGSALAVFADGAAQVVLTTNTGDRLSGQVVSVTAEYVELETPYAGRIHVRAAEIKSWQTGDEKLRQQIAAAWPNKLAAAAQPINKALSANKADVKKPVSAPTKANKAETWQRSINLAYTFSRGNANVNDLNAALGLTRTQGAQRTVFNALGRYSVRNGAQVAHLLSSTFRYENALNKLPAFSETIFEIDRIKRLDYRLSENLGLTYPALKRDGQALNLDFGTGVTREVFSNGQQRTIATSLLRAKAEMKLNGKAQLSQQVSFFSDLLDPDNYRMQTDVSLTMPITKYLGFRVAGLNRYDNRPAAVNVKQSDFSLLTGFNINF